MNDMVSTNGRLIARFDCSCINCWTRDRQRQPPTAAQACNEDVSNEIFAQVSRESLTSVARVCRNWLLPARRRLYYQLSFDTGEAYAPALAAVLRDQPVIRSFIRELALSIPPFHPFHPRDLPLLDWVQLLPEHSLRSIELLDVTLLRDEALSLLDLPAFRTVLHLGIHHWPFLTPNRLREVPSMQHLESLTMFVSPATWSKPLSGAVTAFPRLQRLSLWSDTYSAVIEELLLSLPTPLKRFDLRSEKLREAELASLQNGLTKHAPHLRRVSLFGSWFAKFPFVGDYVSCLPSLETLLCGYALYSPQIFSRLPPSTTALTLCTTDDRTIQFSSDALAAALRENRNRFPHLKTVTMVHNRWRTHSIQSLQEACTEEGIRFRTLLDTCLYSVWA